MADIFRPCACSVGHHARPEGGRVRQESQALLRSPTKSPTKSPLRRIMMGGIFKARVDHVKQCAKLRRTATSEPDSGPNEGNLPVQRNLARQLTAPFSPPRSDSAPRSPTSPSSYSPSPLRRVPCHDVPLGLRGRLSRTAKRSQQAADLPQMLLLQEQSVQVSTPSREYVCLHRHTLSSVIAGAASTSCA